MVIQMLDSTFQMSDLAELKHRFDELIGKIKSFFDSTEYPSVKAHMIKYVNLTSTLESEAISLRSEVSITKAIAESDYKRSKKVAYSNATAFDTIQRWQSDILIDGESTVIDTKRVCDCLESMYSTLDEYKWLIKHNRELAANYYKYLSGDE
jgi:hypothetical protein